MRNEFPFGNYTTELQASSVIVATFIIYTTLLSIKEALIEIDILLGIIPFACIAFEFSKIVRTTVGGLQNAETVALYQKILHVMTMYNEVHGLLAFTYVIDLLIFSSLSATNILAINVMPYNGFVFSTFIVSYFLASFAAINVSPISNFANICVFIHFKIFV